MVKSLRLVLCFVIFVAGVGFGHKGFADDGAKSDAEALALFEQITQQWLARSPMMQADLGLKTDYDKWEDLSEAFALESHKLHQKQLKALQAIDTKDLSESVSLSYRLMEQRLRNEIEYYQWRHHDYPVNQMFGWHSVAPSILINVHTITNKKEAEDYIARLNGINDLFDQLIKGLLVREKKGILAPAFVYPKVIEDSYNLLKGAPFDKGQPSALLSDFSSKVAALQLPGEQKEALIHRATQALLSSVEPAYLRLIQTLKKLEKKADMRAGVWKLPKGVQFYNAALKRTTTTGLSADDIHAIGLQEVARIHEEMRSIMRKVKFKGDLRAFFNFMQKDEQFYYPNNDEGRQAYLQRAKEVIAQMDEALPQLFYKRPKAELIVKPVEAFREKSAGAAFYQSPPTDDSRPGIYYVNLYNMNDRPKYVLESLAYHEALPGHHYQLSIANELGDLPTFRILSHYTAYIEGWGLYAELLPKEIGFYQDPYSDFGRLEMELWRACRLVVDTGLHAKKWSYKKAIDYLNHNTPSNEQSNRKAIERYIVMPSQATAYKVGMMKILELREQFKKQQGEKYDIRDFHDRVLGLGAVPLNILEQEVLR